MNTLQPVERRQLTIVFCDIAGSTALSTRLDPEDLREVIVAYRLCVGDVARRCGGYVAQHVGDGTLVYFGYPAAHESDAERAIYAALELNRAVSALAIDHRISIRIGIATGVVVVGDFSEEAGLGTHCALGEAPNLAARLQEIAAPGSVVVCDLTKTIAGPLFEFRSLGQFTFKGTDRAIPVWEAMAASPTASRSHALQRRGLPPPVGRDAELTMLHQARLRAKRGEGGTILLRGEAGIGKSRLVLSFLQQLEGEEASVLKYYCSSQHTEDAYFPLLAELERAAGIEARDAQDARAEKLARILNRLPGMTPEQSALLVTLASSAPTSPPSQPVEPRERRRAVQQALLARITLTAAEQPLVVLVEDAHWADPTSNEVLHALIERAGARAILIIVTARPEYQPAWLAAAAASVRELAPLSDADIETIVTRVAKGRALARPVIRRIVARSDGVPLFAEELTAATLASGDVPDDSELSLPAAAMPPTLRASLVARLDRAPLAKQLAGIGATIGRDFSYDLLAAVSGVDAAGLKNGLDQLIASGLLEQDGVIPDARFTFKHALLQDAAYGTLLRRRRAALHARIAETLETAFPALSAAQPQILARHFTKGLQPERARPYWLAAARIASERYANLEAVSYATRGLEGLRAARESAARARAELDLLAVLGPALIATIGNGADATLKAYERGRALMRDVRSSEHWDVILLGLGSGYWTRADHRAAIEVATEFVDEAERRGEDGPSCVAHRLAAAAHLIVGNFARGAQHGEIAYAFYDPACHRNLVSRYGTDAGTGAACQWALGAWHMGDVARSSEILGFANAHAEHIAHPNTTCYVLYYGGAFPAFVRRDFERVREFTERLKTFAASHDLPHWFDHGLALEGPALAHGGKPTQAIESAREGLERCERSGHKSARPTFLAGLAEASMMAGRFDDATRAIEAALSFTQATEARWMDAELWRLRGALALASGGTANLSQARRCFSRGLEVARAQGSRSLETRLAASLAELSDRGLTIETDDLSTPGTRLIR